MSQDNHSRAPHSKSATQHPQSRAPHGNTRGFGPEHGQAAPKKKRLWQQFIGWSRTIHIYLTMMGLLAMVLFGATGYTINHEDWFGATHPVVVEFQGSIPKDPVAKGDRLAVVEQLRAKYRISGAVTSYDDFEDEVAIAFKEPGQIWEIRIAKPTGQVDVHHETFNFAALINNLHRGRYSGESWRWVIDVSALLIVLACVTGFFLWLALPRRRRAGIAFLAAGTLITLGVIYLFVPGGDWGLEPPPAPKAAVSTGN
jgi:hypothetical protein